LLLEVMLGIAVFSLFMLAVGMTMIAGQENTVIGGAESRATYLADRALDVTRAIRDASYSSVSAGQHGFAVNSGGKWAFSGSTSTTTGSYTTWVYVSQSSTGLLLSARSIWKHGYNKSGSVVLKTELTDWRAAGAVGNWSSVSLAGSVTPGGAPDFGDVIVTGDYALITGDGSSGGNGIYIYDVSDPASPVRVNSSFNLGYDAYQMAIRGKTLYVLTDDSNAELKAYKLTSLPSLTYVTSYNLQGSGRGRALRVYGSLLYLGATLSGNSGEKEFRIFDISNSGSLVAKATLDDTADVSDLALSGTAAYLATADDAGEMHVVNVANSGSVVSASGAVVNVSGTEDGLAMALYGTAALLGRARGSGIQELVMYEIPASGGAPLSSGPWYHEMSGSVVGVAADPTGCYAFAATRQKWKALQIVRMKDMSLTELSYYTLSSGAGRRLFYSAPDDKIFFISDTTLYIFEPGAPSGSC
jgi:hypothetical protein